MPLTSGTRLGPYLIDAPLGAGGMGEVYRARDTRLDRPVAIKVLPTIMAESAELHERFEREARLLSNLNHPHICVVYDVGRQGDMSFLVMELLEGETLAARIARGPLPVAQATSIALQIGAALDRAHRIGVVHRDVKPENVMLTKAGAKLLDFGLAKPAPIKGELGVATRTMPLTGQGTIIGTLHYMAPEQLEGRPADARSDIFAFGAVLYEMITGKRAFAGGTPVSVISSILRDTPRPIPELQPFVPPALDAIVRTCLEKDPDDRWHSAHDLASQLRWIQQSGSQPHVPTTPLVRRRRRYSHVAWGVGCLLALGAGVAGTRYLNPTPVARSVWFTMGEPSGTRFSRNPIAPFAAISPDGRHIVFDASVGDAGQLFLRALNSTESRQLPGTEDAWMPFWSADSRYVGFFADGALKKTAIATGGVETICKIHDFEGGTWSRDNVVIFSKAEGGLSRVDAGGGEPKPLTSLDQTKGEVVHRLPVFLPDGQHFLYLAQPGNEVFYGSLDGTAPRRLLAADGRAVYSPPGFLLYARDAALFAQPFDAARGQLSGDPMRVTNSVRATPLSGRAAYSVSDNGVLVFRAGDARNNVQIRWADRSGKRLDTVLEEADYRGIALSPDGTRIAFHRHEDPVGGGIWIKDILRGQPIRLTTDPSHNSDPVWSPDGTRIAFTSDRNRIWDIFIRDASGTGRDQILLKSEEGKLLSQLVTGPAVPAVSGGCWSQPKRHLGDAGAGQAAAVHFDAVQRAQRRVFTGRTMGRVRLV